MNVFGKTNTYAPVTQRKSGDLINRRQSDQYRSGAPFPIGNNLFSISIIIYFDKR